MERDGGIDTMHSREQEGLSTIGLLVSHTTGQAFRALYHQNQVDFFAQCKGFDFNDTLTKLKKSPQVPQNHNVFLFIYKKAKTNEQREELRRMFQN